VFLVKSTEAVNEGKIKRRMKKPEQGCTRKHSGVSGLGL